MPGGIFGNGQGALGASADEDGLSLGGESSGGSGQGGRLVLDGKAEQFVEFFEVGLDKVDAAESDDFSQGQVGRIDDQSGAEVAAGFDELDYVGEIFVVGDRTGKNAEAVGGDDFSQLFAELSE